MKSGLAACSAAFLVSAATTLSAMPTAVERGVVLKLVAGESFRTSLSLTQDLVADGGKLLRKGEYDVLVSSLGGEKVRATFRQGGMTKGEAQGIIVVATPASARGGGNTHLGVGDGTRTAVRFSDIGLGPQSRAACFPPVGTIKIGGQGSHEIVFGLSTPAARQGAIAPRLEH